MEYDKIIIGAGFYGLYSAVYCGEKGQHVLVLEKEDEAFERASYINQARVHMGYHYPRSYSTAIKSAGYFEKFNNDYGFSIMSEFDQIYATSSRFSWTDAAEFKKFCDNCNIMCEKVSTDKYFKLNMCDGAFKTKEYTYDAQILKKHLLDKIYKMSNIEIRYNSNIESIIKQENKLIIKLETKEAFISEYILNSTYAGINQIINKLGFDMFEIKYELCEIILCEVSDELKNTGITVMDGPFFSIMPFGKTKYHSLTSVTFTPHKTDNNSLPNFDCQENSNGYCTQNNLGNCNKCKAKPNTAWNYMSNLAKKYLKEELKFEYKESIFSMKPILKTSEIDDSRPTKIKKFCTNPTFVSVLSGKINTVYDLEEVLKDE